MAESGNAYAWSKLSSTIGKKAESVCPHGLMGSKPNAGESLCGGNPIPGVHGGRMAKVGKAPKKEEKQERRGMHSIKIAEGMEDKGLRGIVRIAGKDLRGDFKLKRALLYIKGIGHSLINPVARMISAELGISEDTPVGSLTDEQIASIDKVLFSMDDSKLSPHLLNDRADIYEGNNRHMIMNDLDFINRRNVDNKKKMWSWQGERLIKGKKARGQRTRNTGRRGLAVGVTKKKEVPAPGAQSAKPGAAASAPAPSAAKSNPPKPES